MDQYDETCAWCGKPAKTMCGGCGIPFCNRDCSMNCKVDKKVEMHTACTANSESVGAVFDISDDKIQPVSEDLKGDILKAIQLASGTRGTPVDLTRYNSITFGAAYLGRTGFIKRKVSSVFIRPGMLVLATSKPMPTQATDFKDAIAELASAKTSNKYTDDARSKALKFVTSYNAYGNAAFKASGNLQPPTRQ